MKQILRSIILSSIFVLLSVSAWAAGNEPIPAQLPVPGRVTMIDLGANKCIPCKMMAPILKEVRNEYKDQAAIVFIDVWKDPLQAKKFGIRSIPTQIFYDHSGNEVFRHEGFFDKQSIVAKLEEIRGADVGKSKPSMTDDFPVRNKATLIMIDYGSPQQSKNNIMDLLNGVQRAFPKQLAVVYVNGKDFPEVAQKFNVSTGPTMLFFNRMGQEIHRTQQIPALDQIIGIFQKAGERPTAADEPNFRSKGKPSLLCLGDQQVVPMEKILPHLNELLNYYSGGLEVVYADRNEYPDLANRYNIANFPAYILFDKQGREIYRTYGMMTNQEIIARFGQINPKP